MIDFLAHALMFLFLVNDSLEAARDLLASRLVSQLLMADELHL